MIRIKLSVLVAILLIVLLLSWTGALDCSAQQDETRAVRQTDQGAQVPEKIVAAPQNAKEETGIWVFVIWIWISVFVLIYFLRLKIKEADRLYRLRFYSAKKN